MMSEMGTSVGPGMRVEGSSWEKHPLMAMVAARAIRISHVVFNTTEDEKSFPFVVSLSNHERVPPSFDRLRTNGLFS